MTIVRIDGDGVGPELIAAGSRLIETVCGTVRWVERPAGLEAWAEFGSTAPAETISAIREYKLAIKGPFATPNGGNIRSGNYYIRRELDLYACLRPIPVDRAHPILLVRENLEDLYGAEEWMSSREVACALKVASQRGCRRIADYAFALARRQGRAKVTVVHKANNLKLTEGMFLAAVHEASAAFPDIAVDDMIADTACATLVLHPDQFDVILTSNTLGDLLSSLGAAVAGSVGLVGSLNSGHGTYVAEAGHGDATGLVGRGVVNPLGLFDSIRLLLDAIGREAEAGVILVALDDVFAAGMRTPDLGGATPTHEIVDFVCTRAEELSRRVS